MIIWLKFYRFNARLDSRSTILSRYGGYALTGLESGLGEPVLWHVEYFGIFWMWILVGEEEEEEEEEEDEVVVEGSVVPPF